MVHALSRKLLITDFNELSVGMILDYIERYDILHGNKDSIEQSERLASQSDFNNF